MKKLVSALLIGSMLLIPAQTYAADEKVITTLSFDKIEEEILARNPVVIANNDQVSDGWSDLSDGTKKLKDLRDKLKAAQKLIIDQYFPGQTVEAVMLLVPPTLVSKPEDSNTNDQELLKYMNRILVANYETQIQSIQQQIDGLEDKQDDLWKSILQKDAGNYQLVWGTEQLFITYNGLSRQQADLVSNISLLDKQVKVANLQKELGFATGVDVKGSELKLKELNQTNQNLTKQREYLKQQINLMLGQDVTTGLMIEATPKPDYHAVNTMDYEEELDDALDRSFNVRLQDKDLKHDDEERKFIVAFKQAFDGVKEKKDSLSIETDKLQVEKEKLDHLKLKYDLGMVSKLEYDAGIAAYQAQENKVKGMDEELFKAYRKYQWMKKGLTL